MYPRGPTSLAIDLHSALNQTYVFRGLNCLGVPERVSQVCEVWWRIFCTVGGHKYLKHISHIRKDTVRKSQNKKKKKSRFSGCQRIENSPKIGIIVFSEIWTYLIGLLPRIPPAQEYGLSLPRTTKGWISVSPLSATYPAYIINRGRKLLISRPYNF